MLEACRNRRGRDQRLCHSAQLLLVQTAASRRALEPRDELPDTTAMPELNSCPGDRFTPSAQPAALLVRRNNGCCWLAVRIRPCGIVLARIWHDMTRTPAISEGKVGRVSKKTVTRF
jgi:hypothetical protein